MARGEIAGGGTKNFARAGAGGARLGPDRQITPRKLTPRPGRILQERLKANPELAGSADLPEVEKQIREQVKADYQIVPPGYPPRLAD